VDEQILSGYCRALDRSRMVVAEEDGGKWEADCAWPDCPHAPACEIAARLAHLAEKP